MSANPMQSEGWEKNWDPASRTHMVVPVLVSHKQLHRSLGKISLT